MKILFACGGTGGHINPAIAVANYIKSKDPKAQILFAGNPNGMEARLVPQAGFSFVPIEIMGLQRKINMRNIRYNVKSLLCLMTANKKAKKIIKEFSPDIVMGTGGYVSAPILYTAHKLGVKTVAHEQNAYPGIANKMSFKFVDSILLAVEEVKKYLPEGKKYTVTGNPIRQEIIFADREKARAELGVSDKICLLTFGGSLGAAKINEAVTDIISWHKNRNDIYHIHATGKGGAESFPNLLLKRGINHTEISHLDIRDYINNMADCLAASDLVICRSGAITLSELQAAGKASMLIPSPNVAENHQYHNAKILKDHGAAVLIEEKDLKENLIISEIEKLIENPKLLEKLGENAAKMAVLDSNERIYSEILKILSR